MEDSSLSFSINLVGQKQVRTYRSSKEQRTANNALPKLAAGRRNFSSGNMATLVWGRTSLNELFVTFIFLFQISITAEAGQPMNPTNFGNAKRWLIFFSDLTI